MFALAFLTFVLPFGQHRLGLDAAVKCYVQASAKFGTEGNILSSLGAGQLHLGQYQSATDTLKKAAEFLPDPSNGGFPFFVFLHSAILFSEVTSSRGKSF